MSTTQINIPASQLLVSYSRNRWIKVKIKLKETAKEKKGWSLYRLAKELHLPQQTVYSWASGRTQPSFENMDRLCDILECSIGELFETEPVQHKLNLVANN